MSLNYSLPHEHKNLQFKSSFKVAFIRCFRNDNNRLCLTLEIIKCQLANYFKIFSLIFYCNYIRINCFNKSSGIQWILLGVEIISLLWAYLLIEDNIGSYSFFFQLTKYFSKLSVNGDFLINKDMFFLCSLKML